jgi:hypothetical protein
MANTTTVQEPTLPLAVNGFSGVARTLQQLSQGLLESDCNCEYYYWLAGVEGVVGQG